MQLGANKNEWWGDKNVLRLCNRVIPNKCQTITAFLTRILNPILIHNNNKYIINNDKINKSIHF